MKGIYKITNKLNNNCYIGKSIDIERRFKEHKTHAFYQKEKNREWNKVLYRAIRKYGIENFSFEILEEVEDSSKLDEREMFWINFYDSYNNGYNETPGGDGVKNNQGENHPNHKVDELTVIEIRQRWAECKISTRELYYDYKDKIGKSGFKKIYSWQTWKNILPELNTQERRNWHRNNGKSYSNAGERSPKAILSDKDVYDIRIRYKNGESVRSIYKDYEKTGMTYGSFCCVAYGYNRKYIQV